MRSQVVTSFVFVAILCGVTPVWAVSETSSDAASETTTELPSDAYRIDLPSGITADFFEVITAEPGIGLTYRFRFVSDELPKHADHYEKLENDMLYLCENFALQRLPDPGPRPNHVVISIADRVAEYGVYDAEINQFFDSFDVSDGSCVWELY